MEQSDENANKNMRSTVTELLCRIICAAVLFLIIILGPALILSAVIFYDMEYVQRCVLLNRTGYTTNNTLQNATYITTQLDTDLTYMMSSAGANLYATDRIEEADPFAYSVDDTRTDVNLSGMTSQGDNNTNATKNCRWELTSK